MSGMESFIEKQTKLLRIQPAEVPDKDPQQVPKEYVDSGLLDKAVVAQELNKSGPGTETELADTAFDLILLLLMEQWKWLCTESMQKFLHIIFGTLVQRFFGRNPGSEQVSAELESCLGVIPAAPHQQTFDLLPWRHYPGVAGPQCLC